MLEYLTMKEKVENYVVSSANWEFDIDDRSPTDACMSGLLMAFKTYGNELMISTTIMVSPKNSYLNNDFIDSEFFSSISILEDLGIIDIANELKKYEQTIHEIKSTKK